MTKKEALIKYLKDTFDDFDKKSLIEESDSNFKYNGAYYIVYSTDDLDNLETEIVDGYLNSITESHAKDLLKAIISERRNLGGQLDEQYLIPNELDEIDDYFICEG